MAWLRDLPTSGPDICSKMCLFAPEAIIDLHLTYFQPVGALFLRLKIHTPEIYILLTYFGSYYLKFLICPGLIILLLSELFRLIKSCLSKEFLHIPSFQEG